MSAFARMKKERGIGLILALLTLLVFSTLAAGLILVTNTEIWTTANYRLATQGRYAAEYGAQNTALWLAHNNPGPVNTSGLNVSAYPVKLASNGGPVVLSGLSEISANYPDSAVQEAFDAALSNQSVPALNNFKYSTVAKLLSMVPVGGSGTQYLQIWQITSQASLAGLRNAQVQVTENVQRVVGSPLYQYAILGTGNSCGSITLSNNASIDSFDSSAGTYAATVQNTGGNLGTNGNLNLGAGTAVKGTLSDPNSGLGACSAGSMTALASSGGSVTEGLVTLSTPITAALPEAPSPVPPTTNEYVAGNCGSLLGCTNLGANMVALVPGTYGNLNVSGGTTVRLSDGSYNVNSLVLTGGSPMMIDSGTVIINVNGVGTPIAIDLSGGSLSNPSGIPMNCQILYAGSGAIKLSGGPSSFALINAPNAAVSFSGGSDWYGAIIGAVVNSSGTAIHYDRGLSGIAVTAGKFQIVGFNWNKF